MERIGEVVSIILNCFTIYALLRQKSKFREQ